MECPVCLEEYDAAVRRPKSLPCGHTFCLHCLQRMTSLKCPECRKQFSMRVTSLSDNFAVLGLVDEQQKHRRTSYDGASTSNPKFWCRVCIKAATEECMELKHNMCTLRQLRAEQATPKLQQLQNAAASARRVLQALQGARDAVEAQLAEWRGRLRQVEEAERELRVARDEGRDAVQADGLEQLRDAASLLEARCRVQLQLDKDGAEWKTDLQLAAVDLYSPLLIHLHLNGHVVKVGQVEATSSARRAFLPEECRDAREVTKRPVHGMQEEFLQDPGLNKVRQLKNVNCDEWPMWCKKLLRRVAPRLEYLSISEAVREHLQVIRDMPRLRFLYVSLKDTKTHALDLPLQLEDLKVRNVGRQHLLSVQRMPNLRKLSLRRRGSPLRVSFPPLPPHHRGLQWLQVHLRPASTFLSLAKAHAATLQELRILCASKADPKWYFGDLANGLRRCGLVALRRVVLMRGRGSGHRDETLPHSKKSCRRQKEAVWEQLLATNSETVRTIKIFCEECDEVPAYPVLGEFTWLNE